MDPQAILQITNEMKQAIEAFKREHKAQLEALELKMNRQALGRPQLDGTAPADAERETKEFVGYLRTGERKAMSTTAGPEGGYTVPATWASQIVSVGAEEGAIRKLARVERTQGGKFEQPIARNLAGAQHVNERQDRTETTTPDFAMFESAGGALAAVAPISNWLVTDSNYDLAKFITESIGQQFGLTEAADFVSGDGVGKARGFTTVPQAATGDATRPWGTVEKLHAGSTSAITIDNLIDLKGKLAPRYRKGASWVMHPDTETAIRKLKASTSGDYYWQPSVAAGEPNTLLGLPVFIDPFMPTIGSGAATVAVADWRKFFIVVDVGLPLMLRDQLTAKGKTLFYSEKRVDGGVLDFNAGKLLVMST